MRSLKQHLPGLLIMASILFAFILSGAGLTNAAESSTATSLELSAPGSAEFGSPVQVKVMLKDSAGQPVDKAAIQFYSPATFIADTKGLMRIGEAKTDDQGVALFEYVSRRTGEIQIVAEYQGSDRYAPSRATATIALQGNHQLYEAEAGVKVPLISKWFLVGILGAVWITIFFVVTLVIRVALSPPAADRHYRGN